jgi:hypothetical protein
MASFEAGESRAVASSAKSWLLSLVFLAGTWCEVCELKGRGVGLGGRVVVLERSFIDDFVTVSALAETSLSLHLLLRLLRLVGPAIVVGLKVPERLGFERQAAPDRSRAVYGRKSRIYDILFEALGRSGIATMIVNSSDGYRRETE